MKKFIHVVISMIALMMLSACGGGGGDTEVVTPPPVALTFKEVSEDLAKQSYAMTLSSKAFIEKYNVFAAFDPFTATGDAIIAPIEEMLAAGQIYLKDLENYNALMAQHYSYISSSTSSQIELFVSASDLNPSPEAQLGAFMANGQSRLEALAALRAAKKPDGSPLYTDAEIQQAAFDSQKEYVLDGAKMMIINSISTVTGLVATAITGAGIVLSTGAVATTAPVLIPAAIAGVVVGTGTSFVLNWCYPSTPSEKLERDVEGDDAVCSMFSGSLTAVQLPNGEAGYALSLPQGGPGTLCMHIEGKSPLCFDTTIDAEGNTIILDCADDEYDPAQSKNCSEGIVVEDGITIPGENCVSDVYSLSSSASAGSSGAAVAMHINLPTSGCTINYNLTGTDGYTQSGSLVTDSSGNTSFSVPAGADGVHDSITMTAVESGATTTAGYTF